MFLKLRLVPPKNDLSSYTMLLHLTITIIFVFTGYWYLPDMPTIPSKVFMVNMLPEVIFEVKDCHVV